MLFREIAGHGPLKQGLINALNAGRLSHAQLFLGEEGSGNLAMAVAYAQYISCLDKKQDDACGRCISCTKYEKLAHPDLHFVFPTATTAKVTKNAVSSLFMEEWREALLEDPYLTLNGWMRHIGAQQKQGIIPSEESNQLVKTLSLKSYESEFKVVIIWLAEKLNISAANKLLKMIEEPPEKTLIFLVSENHELMLPTILSRTQTVRVGKISREELQAALQQTHPNVSISPRLVGMSNGNYLKARKLIEHRLVDEELATEFKDWTRKCYKPDIPGLISWADHMATKGREEQKLFFDYGLHVFRESLMLNYGNDAVGGMEDSEVGFTTKFAPFVHMNNARQLIETFDEGSYHIERNAHPKILFLDLSLKVTKLLRIKNVNL